MLVFLYLASINNYTCKGCFHAFLTALYPSYGYFFNLDSTKTNAFVVCLTLLSWGFLSRCVLRTTLKIVVPIPHQEATVWHYNNDLVSLCRGFFFKTWVIIPCFFCFGKFFRCFFALVLESFLLKTGFPSDLWIGL